MKEWTNFARNDEGCAFVRTALAAAAVALVFLAPVSASDRSGRAPLAKTVDAIVRHAMEVGPYPGIAVSISRDGVEMLDKGYGVANFEDDAPVTPESVFAVGSITKSFTCLGAAQLAADGKIGLDDSVRKYIPELPAGDEGIRIRNLMNHSSGLVNYVTLPELRANIMKDHSHADMLQWFVDAPLQFTPGARFSYTNSGTYLLGMVVERASGMSYADYVTKRIFEPLGMESTYYDDPSRIIEHRVKGYARAGDEWKNARRYSPSVPFSAGALLSTAHDLTRYLDKVHNKNFFGDDVRKVLYAQDMLEDGTKSFYALGCLNVSESDGRRKLAHSGEIFGFSGTIAYYPDDKVAIAVLSNNQGGFPVPPSIERKIARAVFGIPAPEIEDLPLTEDEVAALPGKYESYPAKFGADARLELVYENDHLVLYQGARSAGAPGFSLRSQGDGRFVGALDDEMVIVFNHSGEGVTGGEIRYVDAEFRFRRIGGSMQ